MKNDRDYLLEASRRILRNDPELASDVGKVPPENFASTAREVNRVMKKKSAPKGDAEIEALGGVEDTGPEIVMETIVQKVGRPVLLVQGGDYRVDDPLLSGEGTGIWKRRLFEDETHRRLRAVIPAVGRVEVANNPDYEWVGTAWLIAEDIVVTNRHVAEEFAERRGAEFNYLPGFPENAPMEASVDFLEEFENPKHATFKLKDILYISDRSEPDMALLKIERWNGTGSKLDNALVLAKEGSVAKEFVATFGYPASDSRVPDQDLVKKFFGDIYNKKRLAPGQVLREQNDLLLHDCSTLGGNSGSCVVRVGAGGIGTGEVLGLHFSGLFLRENRAIPARIVADILSKVKQGEIFVVNPGDENAKKPAATEGGGGSSVAKFNLQVPVELSISLGVPSVADVGPVPVIIGGNGRGAINDAVRQVEAMVAGKGVLEVRKGFAFENGWITQKPAVVVLLAESSARALVAVPRSVLGIPVEVRDPGLAELMPQNYSEVAEGVRKTTYKRPEGFSLKEVNEQMEVICHLSPDAGWPVLQKFLQGTTKELTMGIYDFTAPHVIKEMMEAVKKKPRTFKLVMQTGESMQEGEGIKGEDWRESKVIKAFENAMDDRFSYVAASVGVNRQFGSSYHIKVVVRDGTAVWLSSGNLQSSNQYETAPEAGSTDWWHLISLNREWNVVIENKTIAQQFKKFLEYDYDCATAEEGPAMVLPLIEVEEAPLAERLPSGVPTYFEPLRANRKVKVMPLLTPDNYDKEVLKLIESAEEEILFQNQSLNLQGVEKQGQDKNDARFVKLYEALLEKQKAGVKVSIIIRGDFNPQTYVERLQEVGFDMERVKLQNHCHTKGLVVDGKRVLVGSHNWTNEGTLVNRDASLIFDDEEIALYYAKVFWFDWKKLAKPSVGAPRRVRRVRGGDNESVARDGWRRLTLSDLSLSDIL